VSEYAIKFCFSKFLNYFKSQLPGHITETPNAYYPVSTVKITCVKRFLYNHTRDKKKLYGIAWSTIPLHVWKPRGMYALILVCLLMMQACEWCFLWACTLVNSCKENKTSLAGIMFYSETPWDTCQKRLTVLHWNIYELIPLPSFLFVTHCLLVLCFGLACAHIKRVIPQRKKQIDITTHAWQDDFYEYKLAWSLDLPACCYKS